MYSCIYGTLIIEQAEMKIMCFYCQSDIDSPEEINQNPISNSLITHKTFFNPSQSSGFCLCLFWGVVKGRRQRKIRWDTVFLTEDSSVG